MKTQFNEWVATLSQKYKQSQIKAEYRVNSELIKFYFELGKEINDSNYKKEYGNSFFVKLSDELKKSLPNTTGFSARNLEYIESFYMNIERFCHKLWQNLTIKKLALYY